MTRRRIDDVTIENAQIKYPNFAGRGSDYNREGYRNFCVVIPDPEMAQQMAADGWNVKHHDPREDGDPEDFDYIQVSVRFDKFPPLIVMITDNRQIKLNESNVSELDRKRIISADMVINPSFWERNGKAGIKAYLQEMFVKVNEKSFASKYGYVDGAVHPNDYSQTAYEVHEERRIRAMEDELSKMKVQSIRDEREEARLKDEIEQRKDALDKVINRKEWEATYNPQSQDDLPFEI